jgi:hypothetical protein
VAAVLVAKGATLVDTDAIARSLTEAGGARCLRCGSNSASNSSIPPGP